ncbi:MAG: hypothetical protein ACRDGU_03060 [Actinomycetota bacterium]
MEGARKAARLVIFQSLASLFLPADEARHAVILDAGERWRLDEAAAAGADTVVWGREALRSGTPSAVAIRWALARERGIVRVRRRPPAPLEVTGVHRLPPPRLAPGVLRNRLREALLGGALVELGGPRRGPRLIDWAAEAAGATGGVNAFRPGSGGSGLARIRGPEGSPLVLRLARSGGPGDPHRAAQALERLSSMESALVPRPAGKGRVNGVSWTAETALPGRPPSRITQDLAAQVAAFCAGLPRAEGQATAHSADLLQVARRFPHWTTVLSEAVTACDQAALSVPALMRHGDLWAGNLLAERGGMTAVIDWDAWHPAALPGTDLLHLVAMEEGRKTSRGMGRVWLARPWESESYSAAGAGYWNAIGVRPDPKLLEAVGIAWWAGQVAATLARLPFLAGDERWVEANVETVLTALMG